MLPFGPPLATRRWPVWTRYAVTTILFGFVLLLARVWADASLHLFWLFLTVIIACAAVLDRGTSFYATALSAAVLGYGAWTGDPALAGGIDFAAWLFFVIVALVTGASIELLHKTVFRLHAANEALLVAEREKDLLLRESAHRFRNDLTRLISLIDLERRAADEPRVKQILEEIADRVRVFSRLQNRLLHSGGETVVQMQEYISDLCQDVHSSLAGIKPVTVAAEADSHPVDEPTAVVIGLIANELVTNAIKHAFPDNRAGAVNVTFRCRDDELVLCVEDNGIGVEPEAVRDGSLGQNLIRSLVCQLQGRYEIRRRRDGPGTIASIRLPPPARAKRIPPAEQITPPSRTLP